LEWVKSIRTTCEPTGKKKFPGFRKVREEAKIEKASKTWKNNWGNPEKDVKDPFFRTPLD